MSLNASDPYQIVGWQTTSDDRGSLDILWSCLVTLLLCCWVSTYPNAGSPSDKWYHPLLDKFNLAIITFLGPDFLFGIALGQFASARESVKAFRRDSHLTKGFKWRSIHAFFVDMGCLHLTAPDYSCNDGRSFPINAEQFYYLVKYNHIDFPNVENWDIQARNSVDTLSRIITVFQALWFTIKEVARVKKGYPITTLELTTLSFCFITFAISILWYHKPSITKPQFIATKDSRTVQHIRECAKRTTHPGLSSTYYRTPLEFVGRRRFGIDAHWSYYVNLAHKMRVNFVSRPITRDPWDRVPSDMWICPGPWYAPAAAIVLIVFSSMFLFAWNFTFPTQTEKVMWRICSAYHAAFSIYGGIYYAIEMFRLNRTTKSSTELSPNRSDDRDSQDAESQQTTTERLSANHRRLSRALQRTRAWRNLSENQDPLMEVPLRIIVPITITCFFYVFCRAYIYLEDLITLRAQPAGVYLTVNKFLPFLPGGV
ncbi:hypothetical protein B0J13DRAFT_566491 [Dactylonectria estremocensis]|uniref:Uncharacterized protein n=1 Tax=Dactylonectria estremocensis TaxID=1079267 RepID=A0A9P9DQ63_9HYPO|nr:hypothetical protein B0J13DRAFT_566491 [Dactylonectria estremocensis]